MSQEILIIEDDEKLNNGIRLALKGELYAFSQCRTLEDARRVLQEREVSLILLDVNLPDGNGVDFVREVRDKSLTPIILITVNNMELDVVTGLEAGANDYITKPFSLMVLRARVAVQLRQREERGKGQGRIQIDGFDFDFERMEYSKDNQAVELSKTEQRLLRLLCENRGRTLKRSYLIDSVWQGETEYVDEHALTVAIKRLRDKLEEDSKNPAYIKTVYGVGYMWSGKS